MEIINKQLLNIYEIIFKIFILFICIELTLLSRNKNYIIYKKRNNYLYGEHIFNISKDYNNKTFLFRQINKFISLCRKEMLIEKIKYNYIVPPKITAIIPVYNASKTIKPAVRSIQNQNMNEIEIILVDDVSTDNSISIINELMKEDKRIKLIKNKKNKGTLYSRSIGALNARGKYIMSLDNDDLFIYGIFNKCYEEAESNNLDIVEFSGLQICKNCSVNENNIYIPWFLRFKKEGIIIRQPQLSTFNYIKTNTSFEFIDVFVWGKQIKTEIYQKTLKILGNEIYNHNICLTEDKIFTFGLFKVSNSFKYINVYGIIYVENLESVCHTWSKTKTQRIIHDYFMLSVIFYNLSKNSEEVQIVVDELKKHFKEFFLMLDKDHKKILMNLYDRVLKNKNILEKEKKLIKIKRDENKNNLKDLT